jgi:hypothetical protein
VCLQRCRGVCQHAADVQAVPVTRVPAVCVTEEAHAQVSNSVARVSALNHTRKKKLTVGNRAS